jgi:hypothetical protein
MAGEKTTGGTVEQAAPKFQSVSATRRQKFGPAGTQPMDVYEITFVTARGNAGTFIMSVDDYRNDQKYLDRLLEEGFQADKAHYTPGLLA